MDREEGEAAEDPPKGEVQKEAVLYTKVPSKVNNTVCNYTIFNIRTYMYLMYCINIY